MEDKQNLNRVRFLEGKRIFLTPQSEEDFEVFYRREHDRDLEFFEARLYKPKSYSESKEAFDKNTNSTSAMFFAIIHKETGDHIGVIVLYDISYYQRTCQWGIKLGREYWRQGYGTEATRLLMKYVFEDLCFRRLRSGTLSRNAASIRLHESLGFVREGVFRQEIFLRGEYLDSIEYGILKEEYDKTLSR